VKHLLLPSGEHPRALDTYYTLLKKYSFRLFLRDIIQFQKSIHLKDLQKYCSQRTAAQYLQLLVDWHMVNRSGKNTFQLAYADIKSFGDTFEWLVAQILVRDFFCSAAWGICLGETATGGDYDVIAIMEGYLLYVEAKSSPPKHVEQKEIAAFLDRIADLRPQVSIFLEDTHLRMQDKIAGLFQVELSRRAASAGLQAPGVMRLDRELFSIEDTVFIINSRPDIVANIGTCIRHYLKNRGIRLFGQSRNQR
jgi:hypothetical protein